MPILKSALVKASGSRFVQSWLEQIVLASQYLMGIGCGSEVSSSGEKSIFHSLKQRLMPPYCIFDVGANKGQFLEVILENIPLDDLSIHCFEPGQAAFKFLAQSSRSDKRIRLNKLGIGKAKGEAVLHYDRVGSGLASLTKRNLDYFNIEFNEAEQIEITTVDSYCTENGIDHIHLLKIDIEGHELDALVGARGMLAKSSVDFVAFEFGGCNISTRTFFQDFWYFFNNEADFTIFRVTPSGYLRPLKSYEECQEQFRITNFVAILNTIQHVAADGNSAPLHRL